MSKHRLAVVALLLVLIARTAQGSTVQIGSAAALGANDFFDWDQIRAVDGGGNALALPSPRTVTSNLGRSASISDGGAFSGLIEGTDWFGDFASGDRVLYSGDVNDPASAANAFTIAFGTAVRGVGLQITSGAFFDFAASLELFNGGASLGLFNVNGSLFGAEDGSAPFLGALSDSANITSAVFTLTSNTGAGFGVNRLLTADGRDAVPDPGAQVPEPGTLSLFALGIAGAAARRRSRRLR